MDRPYNPRSELACEDPWRGTEAERWILVTDKQCRRLMTKAAPARRLARLGGFAPCQQPRHFSPLPTAASLDWSMRQGSLRTNAVSDNLTKHLRNITSTNTTTFLTTHPAPTQQVCFIVRILAPFLRPTTHPDPSTTTPPPEAPATSPPSCRSSVAAPSAQPPATLSASSRSMYRTTSNSRETGYRREDPMRWPVDSAAAVPEHPRMRCAPSLFSPDIPS